MHISWVYKGTASHGKPKADKDALQLAVPAFNIAFISLCLSEDVLLSRDTTHCQHLNAMKKECHTPSSTALLIVYYYEIIFSSLLLRRDLPHIENCMVKPGVCVCTSRASMVLREVYV